MEILIFNIGIVLFIFTVKFLITSKRKYKPDWGSDLIATKSINSAHKPHKYKGW